MITFTLFSILIDEKKRRRYDRTGVIDDDNDNFASAYERYRGVKVTKEDIADYESKYKYSEQEENDLINYFNKYKGDIRNILSSIIGSNDEDIPRFVEFFEKRKSGLATSTEINKNFKRSKKNIATMKELDKAEGNDIEGESCESESEFEQENEVLEDISSSEKENKKRKAEVNSMESLQAAILMNKNKRNRQFEDILSKYS